MFSKQPRIAEFRTAFLCPPAAQIYSGAPHIIPIASIISVQTLIAWTSIPDNGANLQRRIGDRAIGGQLESDDDLVIGTESTRIPNCWPGLGNLDITECAPGLCRSGGQSQSRQHKGDQRC